MKEFVHLIAAYTFRLRFLWITGLMILIQHSTISGQANEKNENQQQQTVVKAAVLMPGIGIGMNVPGGILSRRYGAGMHLCGALSYLTKSNWIFQGDWLFLFGDQVREDVLAPYRTSTGVIPGDDEQIADIFLRQRGIWAGAGAGRLFPFSSRSRSGLKTVLQGGVFQHYIRFTDERNSVAQVRAGRYVGYDRLTRGFSLKQTLAYQHLSNDKRLNFDIALEAIQAWTSEVRAINFDTGLPTLSSRLDWLVGVRVTWYLPFYFAPDQEVFY